MSKNRLSSVHCKSSRSFWTDGRDLDRRTQIRRESVEPFLEWWLTEDTFDNIGKFMRKTFATSSVIERSTITTCRWQIGAGEGAGRESGASVNVLRSARGGDGPNSNPNLPFIFGKFEELKSELLGIQALMNASASQVKQHKLKATVLPAVTRRKSPVKPNVAPPTANVQTKLAPIALQKNKLNHH